MQAWHPARYLKPGGIVCCRSTPRIFLGKTGTRKSVFFTLLTPFGAKVSEHFLGTAENQLTMEALFGAG